MTKTFKQSTISFLGLSLAMGLFQSLLLLNVGPDLLTQASFANFFLTANLISFVATAFLLRFYYIQQFRTAFITGLIAFFTSLLRALLLYCLLVPLSRAFERYYPLVLVLDLAAGLLAASGLMFSRAGKNYWLKAAGVASFLVASSALVLLIISMQSHSGQSTPTLERWQLALSFIASLQPLFFIGYFWPQPTVLDESNLFSWQTTLVDAARFIGVVAFLFLGVSLFGDGIRASHPQPEAIQQAKVFEARTFRDRRGDTLLYRLLKPEGYDSTQRYPLLISLHGGGGYGTDNIRQLASWEIRRLTEPVNRKKYPAFILAPQCSRGTSWGGLPHLVSRDTIVFELLRALEAEFSIDPSRRYVAGGSLGGYGTWSFIGTHPGVFAAAIPLCGAGDPTLAKKHGGCRCLGLPWRKGPECTGGRFPKSHQGYSTSGWPPTIHRVCWSRPLSRP